MRVFKCQNISQSARFIGDIFFNQVQYVLTNFLLETVQRTRWGNAGHAGSIHSAELDFRDVESDGGGLQSGLHHFQRTGQNGSDCPPTSRRKRVISQGRTVWEITAKSGVRGKKEIRGEKRISVSLLQNSHFE